MPGSVSEYHAYWLFPVMVRRPAAVVAHMLEQGFDVTQGTTQLGPVDRLLAPTKFP